MRYVLEGSVQRSADRIRITAQLIDALTGHHIWAEHYDRDVKDIFALQDEITLKILTATRVKLTEGKQASGAEKYFKGKQGFDCYLKLLEGVSYLQRFNIEGNNVARRIAEEAMAMCPEIPHPYVMLGFVNAMDYWLGSTKSPRESIEKAVELAQKALALDETRALTHGLLSQLYFIRREYDKAIAEGERAVTLDPNGADVYVYYAQSLTYAGRPEEAIPLFQKAIRLNPLGPSFYFYLFGNALQVTGRLEEAVLEYKKALQRAPENFSARLGLAATYSMMGREKEAHAEAAEVLRINPKFSMDYFAKANPYKDQSVTDNLINACRKAGLK